MKKYTFNSFVPLEVASHCVEIIILISHSSTLSAYHVSWIWAVVEKKARRGGSPAHCSVQGAGRVAVDSVLIEHSAKA